MKKNDVKKLIRTISKNWRFMVVVIVIMCISGYLLSAYGLEKHYLTSSEIYIHSLDGESDIQKATTCQLLFTSPQMYDTINENLESGFSYAEYEKMLHVEQLFGTQIIRITADCDNSNASYKLIAKFIELLPTVIEKYKEKATFDIVRSPVEPSEPTFPDERVFTVGGGILGLLISVIGILVIWKLDNTITADDDLTELYNVPVLGELPDFDNEIDYLGR